MLFCAGQGDGVPPALEESVRAEPGLQWSLPVAHGWQEGGQGDCEPVHFAGVSELNPWTKQCAFKHPSTLLFQPFARTYFSLESLHFWREMEPIMLTFDFCFFFFNKTFGRGEITLCIDCAMFLKLNTTDNCALTLVVFFPLTLLISRIPQQTIQLMRARTRSAEDKIWLTKDETEIWVPADTYMEQVFHAVADVLSGPTFVSASPLSDRSKWYMCGI